MKHIIDRNSLNPFAGVVGKKARAYAYDGTELIGVVEAPNKLSSSYAILRVTPNGWFRLTDEIELVVA